MADDTGILGSGGRVHRDRQHRTLRGAAWAVALLVLAISGGLGFVYAKLDGNIAGIDIDGALGSDRPADVPNGSLDLLVLGSDSRTGDNAEYGSSTGDARSDTAMVVHVHRAQQRASIVSIPRDTLVHRPSCEKSGGGTAPAENRAMFNEAYSVGGPACTVKTVERMTGIRMDHYVEVDFTGFKKLINTLGGVKITTSEAIDDQDARLSLEPGAHTLNGEQALGLVRTRKAIGDGSDLGRIQLQQSFVKALTRQVKDIGLLDNPKRLYEVADTATSAITTDSELASIDRLVGMGKALQGIDPDDLSMVTLPVVYDDQQPGRVVPVPDKAAEVWHALRMDEPIPDSALKDTAGDRTDIGDVVD